MTLRAAVIGTGAWARTIHLPGLAGDPRIELVGVWGRDRETTESVAAAAGVLPFHDLDELLALVDLVSIAVTPAAQVPLAVAAARTGAHVVLEKPAAQDAAGALALATAVREAGVEATVFLSRLWDPARQEWLTRTAGSPWETISYDWVSAGMRPGMPGAQGWRKSVGPLLDVAPHVLSIVECIAGPVLEVAAATTDPQGRVLLTLRHAGGCVTTAQLDLFAPVTSTHEQITLSARGEEQSWSNPSAVDFPAAYREMLDDLLTRLATPGRPSARGEESGVAQACAMARLLDDAARLLAGGPAGGSAGR
jgi:predicted dehydrogenase